ncbi:MAG: hypothetical protein QOD92_1039 [Acidimicrobiaceae bacterium]|jgi:hypothetical protein
MRRDYNTRIAALGELTRTAVDTIIDMSESGLIALINGLVKKGDAIVDDLDAWMPAAWKATAEIDMALSQLERGPADAVRKAVGIDALYGCLSIVEGMAGKSSYGIVSDQHAAACRVMRQERLEDES